MVIYSHSSLEAYRKCPLAFKFRYIDKLEGIEGIEGFMGTQVHEAIHYIYKKVKMSEMPTLKQVLEYYQDLWRKNYNPKLRIVKSGVSAQDYFKTGKTLLENYYEKQKPFDENIIGMEQKILIDLDGTNKYILQGFIDKLIHDKETGTYEIHDYKTSNWLPSQEELDEDKQLAIYSIGVKSLLPNSDKIILKWHYLKHGVEPTSTRTDNQLKDLKREMIELIDKIESETEWPAKPSKLCDWCNHNKHCPEYNKKKKLLPFSDY